MRAHQAERVAFADRPFAEAVVEDHFLIFHVLAQVHEARVGHELGREAAELHVVRRDGAERAAL